MLKSGKIFYFRKLEFGDHEIRTEKVLENRKWACLKVGHFHARSLHNPSSWVVISPEFYYRIVRRCSTFRRIHLFDIQIFFEKHFFLRLLKHKTTKTFLIYYLFSANFFCFYSFHRRQQHSLRGIFNELKVDGERPLNDKERERERGMETGSEGKIKSTRKEKKEWERSKHNSEGRCKIGGLEIDVTTMLSPEKKKCLLSMLLLLFCTLLYKNSRPAEKKNSKTTMPKESV